MIHAKVPKSKAQDYILKLKQKDLISKGYEIIRLGEDVLIPLNGNTSVMPEGIETVDIEGKFKQERVYPMKHSGSFDVIGKIAIVKVKTVEKARQISDSIMATNKGIDTVYYGGKLIGSERVRSLVLLGGVDNPVTTHRENGLRFMVDVSKAYFSPRLATERKILSDGVRDGERILDLFAGVGPFSITAASRSECSIDAVDINPEAVGLMSENIALNRMKGTIKPFCADAADFLGKTKMKYDRIIMNLPMKSPDYLDIAAVHLKSGGIINLYVISDIENLTGTMERARTLGLSLVGKRIVHGYSKDKNLYSLELRKE